VWVVVVVVVVVVMWFSSVISTLVGRRLTGNQIFGITTCSRRGDSLVAVLTVSVGVVVVVVISILVVVISIVKSTFVGRRRATVILYITGVQIETKCASIEFCDIIITFD